MYEQRHDNGLDRVDDLFLPDAPEEEAPALALAEGEHENGPGPDLGSAPSGGLDQVGDGQELGETASSAAQSGPEAESALPESRQPHIEAVEEPEIQPDDPGNDAQVTPEVPLPQPPEPVADVAGQGTLIDSEPQQEIERKPLPMGEILAIVNQKGGVGKTTTTINLGAGLVEQGAKVLLVDFDPQGALSVGLGLDPNILDLTVHNLLFDKELNIDQVIYKSKVEGLDIIPSNIDLSVAEMILVSEVARERTLARCLEPIRSRYNYILIDCPPSLGLLTVNALTAAHAVVIPLECEYFALRGMKLLGDTVEMVQERLNPQLEIKGIVATMFDSRTIHGREVLSRVTDAFGEKLFKTLIHKTIRFAEAPVAGEPILTYAPRSAGAQEYRDLAREVMSR